MDSDSSTLKYGFFATVLFPIASLIVTAGVGVLAVRAAEDTATRTVAAEARALLRADQVAAYSDYVEDLQRHRLLLLNNAYLAGRENPDGSRFYQIANDLITELGTDEKRIKLIGAAPTVTKVEAVRKARLRMYNEFVCNAGLQADKCDFERADVEATTQQLEANRDLVDDALTAFLEAARRDVGELVNTP